MNGRHSRFSSSSPAPNKGDFILTSRFERLDKDNSPLIHGSKKGLTQGMTRLEKNEVRKNRVASEIFSDLHLVLMKYNDQRPTIKDANDP